MCYIIRFCVCYFVFFLSNFVFSQQTPLMDLKDIKPGMEGEVKTVFYGFKPETFHVKILGIMKNMEQPNSTMILAKFSGKNIESSGVAQGMSGSPVYIEGKLVGAVAFTWGFLKEAIGGIQPISQMLPVLEKPKQDIQLKAKGNLVLQKPQGPMVPLANSQDIPSHTSNQLNRIGVPLIISGFTEDAFQYTANGFKDVGMTPIEGEGGSDAGAFQDAKEDSGTLKPGDAVGILLMSGDANASAIGTVTYVDEANPKRVLIFGHPFQSLGYVNFPMTRAAVQYTMPIMNMPFKMATPTNVVGTVYNDRSTAVAGVLGKSPSMVPVDVNILDQRQSQKHVFHYNIVPDPNFFPTLLAGAVVSSFKRYNESTTQTVQFDYTLYLKNEKTGKEDELHIVDSLVGQASEISQAMESYITTPLTGLMFNFYDQAKIQRVKVKISYLKNLQVARLTNVIIPKNILKPGETTDIKVLVTTFQNNKEVITIPFTVPYNFQGNVLPISISGGQVERQNYEQMYAGLRDPKNYEQVLDALSVDKISNSIVVYYDTQGITANVDGYTLKNLPLSKAVDYGVKLQGNKYFGAQREKQIYKTNYVIVGDLKSYIMIKDTKEEI